MVQLSEFFISLGVKSSEKTIAALSGVRQGLGGIRDISLEAKAAILGAVYALERLMSSSANQGASLSNLTTFLGLSSGKQLQQWQYAAKQAKVSTEEFNSSLKSVYDKMTQMRLSKGAPEGINFMPGFDVNRAYNDVFYVLDQAKKLANSKTVDIPTQDFILKNFGLSENMVAAMRKGVFNDKNFKAAPFYSDSEIKKLNDVSILWDNLETKVEMFFGHFTAENGKGIVKNISDITTQVLKLSVAFEKLLENAHAFKLIKDSFSGWNTILDSINNRITGKKSQDEIQQQKANKRLLDTLQEEDKLRKSIQNKKKQEEQKNVNENFNFLSLKFNDLKSKFLNSFDNKFNGIDKLNAVNGNVITNYSDILSLFNKKNDFSVVPNLSSNNNPQNNVQNTTISPNLYFQHEGREYAAIQDSVSKAINDTWKQLSAQSQVT